MEEGGEGGEGGLIAAESESCAFRRSFEFIGFQSKSSIFFLEIYTLPLD